MKKKAVLILLLMAAALAVYWPSLQNGFVWDDTALVGRDPFIRSWRLIPEGFRHFLFTDATASNFYRPLQRLTYTLDYALHAQEPAGYHLTNILLHGLAAGAFFLFACVLIAQFDTQRKLNAERLAFLAALLWVVHPVHTAAVVYVAGRADLLAALFGFSGLALALRGRTPGAALCFLAALLSKESGVAFIAALLLILAFDHAQARRWFWLLPAIFAVYAGLRFSAEQTPIPPRKPVPLAERPVLMARAVAEYAGLLAAPVHLHMERDLSGGGHGSPVVSPSQARLRGWQTLLGITLAAVLAAWILRAKQKSPPTWIFLLGFLVSYLPVSNLFILNASAAEHWLYVPSAWLVAALFVQLASLRVSPAAFAVLYCAWLVFFAARTFQRTFDWKDQRTFVERTIADGGDSARMLVNLGMIESSGGHPRQAVAYLEEALRRAPDLPLGLLNLASAHIRLHEFAPARALLEKALTKPEIRPEALLNLTALEYQEHHQMRLDLLREAAELSPRNWPIRKRFINALSESGDTPAAITELRRLLEAQPFRAESWHLMGDLLLKVRENALAKNAFEQAADYDVHDAKAGEQARGL